MHVGLDRLSRRLVRRLEQRADVDVEAEVGERRGDHLLAAVVAVLAHLGDQDPGPAALGLGERLDPARARRSTVVAGRPISSRYTPEIVRISAPWRPQTFSSAVADLADRRLRPRRVDGQRQQVASPAPDARRPLARGVEARRARQRRRRRGRARPAAARSLAIWPARTAALSTLSTSICLVLVGPELVDADHRLAAASRCGPGCGRRPPRCAAWGCRPRSPWPCRRAPRPPGCGPRPRGPARR